MKLSLRWKILAWALLNFALVAAGVAWFLRAQFRVGIHSLLAGPTGVRLDAIARPLAADVLSAPESAWSAALERAAGEWRARGVQAAIFRNDSRFVAGDFRELPAELRAVLAAHDSKMRGPGGGPPPGERREPPDRANRPRREPPPDGPRFDGPRGPRDGPPEREFDFGPPELRRGDAPPARTVGEPPGGFEKFMLIVGKPRRYWAGVHLDSPSGKVPATLLLASDSIRGGGLFFDYVPWLWLGGTLALGSVLLWLPFVQRLTRSIQLLTGNAERIAAGNFEPPPATRRGDELGRLQNAHRDMAGRLGGFVAGQRRFLGDTAHELLSPLARLEVALSILEQRAPDADRAYTDRALGEVRHIATLVHELLTFSKSALAARDVQLEPVALAAIVREAAQREGGETQIEVAIDDDVRALGAPALLSRAIGNVIRNAVRYAPGAIRIGAEPRGGEIALTISDEGPGIPPDALPRIFDPFFRPDTARTSDTGGTGLGLAIVKTCIEACRGTVAARNRTPHGLEVLMTLHGA